MSFDLALIDSDLSIKADGTMRTVEKTAKLRQDIIKIILTPIGSVRPHPWYGSTVSESTVGSLPDNFLFSDIESAISESLDRLITLQRAQATQQNVQLSELIATVQEISADRDPRDLRLVNVRVSVVSKVLEPVEEIFAMRS